MKNSIMCNNMFNRINIFLPFYSVRFYKNLADKWSFAKLFLFIFVLTFATTFLSARPKDQSIKRINFQRQGSLIKITGYRWRLNLVMSPKKLSHSLDYPESEFTYYMHHDISLKIPIYLHLPQMLYRGKITHTLKRMNQKIKAIQLIFHAIIAFLLFILFLLIALVVATIFFDLHKKRSTFDKYYKITLGCLFPVLIYSLTISFYSVTLKYQGATLFVIYLLYCFFVTKALFLMPCRKRDL